MQLVLLTHAGHDASALETYGLPSMYRRLMRILQDPATGPRVIRLVKTRTVFQPALQEVRVEE